MYGKRQKSQSKITLLLGIIAGIILVGVAIMETKGVTIGWKSSSTKWFGELNAQSASLHSFSETFTTLDQWSDELLDKEHRGSQWPFRWDITLKQNNMEQLAQHLYIDEYNSPLNKVISQKGSHITGVIPAYNGKLTLQHIIDEQGTENVVVLLQLEHIPEKDETFKKYVNELDKTITKYANNVALSAKITGTMQPDATKRISSVTDSIVVEEYKDETMKVVTGYSKKLKKSYWLTNNKMINLQYAVYVDKNSKNSILTLAIPLISGEFGQTSAN